MNNQFKIVIDIDDTICNNNNRDYENAIPHTNVILKINDLHKKGYYIILYTSRGMYSCQGNIDMIIKKNKKILEKWLQQHNVHYDELIFGKPLGDLYVDDKALEVRDFVNETFGKLSGGSGCNVERLGKIVIKDFETPEEVIKFKQWNIEANNMCKFPHVISYLYDRVYMDYIKGPLLCECLNSQRFNILLDTIFNFSTKKYFTFDLDYHLNKLYANMCNKLKNKINFCKTKLIEYYDILLSNASFSHGDCILSNIINTYDCYSNDLLIFIDERFNKNASSYLLDLAKIRMSLDDYEGIFNVCKTDRNVLNNCKSVIDTILKKKNIYEIVVILEYMHMLRLYRYKNKLDKEKVIKMLNSLENEQQWKIN